MKKLILMLLVIAAVMSVKNAQAQNAKNNASDNGVPITSPPPQANPAIGVNAVNAPALTVPTAPPVQVLSTPLVAPTPTISAPGVMPAVPAAPAPPPAPASGTAPPPSSFTTTLNLPIVPVLPPIPPIPPMPDVRVPIGSN